MKRFLLSVMTMASLATASPAMSADWTGFYINGGAGYGAWSADTTVVNATTGVPTLPVVTTQGGQGALGTIGVGYDYQYNSNVVLGLLADYDFSSLKGSIQDQGPYAVGTIKQTYAMAAGARIGWLFSPDTLAFISGGWSRAHFSGTSLVSNIGGGTPLNTNTPAFNKNGWFVGLGMETLVSPGWFLRGEYRCAGYDKTTLQEMPTTAGITFKPLVQTGKLQVVYKF